MNGPNDAINELIGIFPEFPADYLYRSILDLISTDDFLTNVISKITIPSKGDLAVRKKRIERFSYSRRNKEVEKYEFLENFISVKNALTEQAIETGTVQGTTDNPPILKVTGSYRPEKGELFKEGLTDFIYKENFRNLDTAYSIGVPINKIMNEKLGEINRITQNNTSLDLYSLGKIVQMRCEYSNDPKVRNKLLNVIQKDVSIRNNRSVSGSNLAKNYEDFMKEVPFKQENKSANISDSKLTKFNKYAEAIVIDELNTVSEILDNEFFGNKISFEQYVKKKNKIYEYANNVWE